MPPLSPKSLRFLSSDCGVGSCRVWWSPRSVRSPLGSSRCAPPSSPPSGALRSWRAQRRSASRTMRRRKGTDMRRCTASTARQSSDGSTGRSKAWCLPSGDGSSSTSRKASRKDTRARNSAATSASTRSCVAMVMSRAARPNRSSMASINGLPSARTPRLALSSAWQASRAKAATRPGSRGTAPMSATSVAAWRPVRPRSRFFSAMAAALPRCSERTSSCQRCQARWNAANSRVSRRLPSGKRNSRAMSNCSP
mmetsp:Transcript_72566/g.216559  ORF Transcript_72566/g.216559 Transcript_72566/m.216559 type:complete len:253 (+) Transcript_72566:834-1592(+)